MKAAFCLSLALILLVLHFTCINVVALSLNATIQMSTCHRNIWDYNGRTVCRGVVVNRPSSVGLRLLRHCDVIDGNLELVHLGIEHIRNWEIYSLPRLREITGFLLIHNFAVLESLFVLLPNLAVIRGQELFKNYALIVSQSTDLQDLGLANLQVVLRGNIFIGKNSALRYLDTVNFSYLHESNKVAQHADKIQHESDWSEAHQQVKRCPAHCSSRRSAGSRCWSSSHCQKVCPECPGGCPEDLHALSKKDGSSSSSSSSRRRSNSVSRSSSRSSIECCNSNCLGGCHHNPVTNSTVCNACQRYFKRGDCVQDCLPPYYKYKDYFCIDGSECKGLRGHKLLTTDEGGNTCVAECPPNYRDSSDKTCKACSTDPLLCSRRCPGAQVSTLSGLQQLRGCSTIDGALTIRLARLGVSEQDYRVALGSIEVIQDYLLVEQSASLVSLEWFTRLRRISGRNLYQKRYALYVTGNKNMSSLWHSSHALTITKGLAMFLWNPLLCPRDIRNLAINNRLVLGLRVHLLQLLNGNQRSCDASIINFIVENSEKRGVKLSWRLTKSSARGYYIFYRKITLQDHFSLNSTDIFNSGWSSHFFDNDWDVDAYTLHGDVLEPFTRYAMYLQTYNENGRTVQSEIKYITTLPYIPSPPLRVWLSPVSSSMLEVTWAEPLHPNGPIDYYKVQHFIYSPPVHDDATTSGHDFCAAFNEDTVVGRQRPVILQEYPSPGQADATHGASSDFNSRHQSGPEYLIDDLSTPLYIHLNSDAARNRSYTGEGCSMATNNDTSNAVAVNLLENTKQSGTGNLTAAADPQAANGQGSDAVSLEELTSPYIHIETLNVKGDELHLRLSELEPYTPHLVQVKACNFKENGCMNGFHSGVALMDDIDDFHSPCKLECSLLTASSVVFTDANATADTVTAVRYTVHDGIFGVDWSSPVKPNGEVQAFHLRIKRGNITAYAECLQPSQKHMTSQPLGAGDYTFSIRTQTSAGESTRPYTGHFIIYAKSSLWWVFWLVIPFLMLLLTITAFVAGAFYHRYRAKKISPRDQLPWEKSSCMIKLPEVDPVFVHAREKLQLESTHIGSGYFGVVRQGELELPCGVVVSVAVKQLRKDKDHHPDIVQEAQIMLKLRSAHVVRSYGVVWEKTGLLLLLELMPGGNLQDFLWTFSPHGGDILSKMELKQVLAMAVQIADGMLYLTYKNIVHRDLAARNCLLDHQHNVKISDFGLSRSVPDDGDFYQLKGLKRRIPFRSMPPEFFFSGINRLQSDVWSYGVLLWEILTGGATPYEEIDESAVRHSIMAGQTLMCSVPGSCPTFLLKLLLQCWAMEPNQRPHFYVVITTILPHLMDTNPTFINKFMSKAFYFTTDGQQYGKKVSKVTIGEDDRNVDGRSVMMPRPPQCPLPPLPTTHDGFVTTYATQRPTFLPGLQRTIGCWPRVLNDSATGVATSTMQEQFNSTQLSPDVISPTSTVSTVLSPLPVSNDGDGERVDQDNFLIERIKSGFSSIQVPLDSLRFHYYKMSLVKTNDKESNFYTNTQEHEHQPEVCPPTSSTVFGQKVGQNANYTLDDSVYQDMRAAATHSTPDQSQVIVNSSKVTSFHEDTSYSIDFQSPISRRKLKDQLSDQEERSNSLDSELPILNSNDRDECDLLDVRLQIEEDNSSYSTHGLLGPTQNSDTNVPQIFSNNLEDDDTIDMQDLVDSDELSSDRGPYPVDRLFTQSISELGLDTPPSSRNNSASSNQASTEYNLTKVESRVVFNIINDQNSIID